MSWSITVIGTAAGVNRSLDEYGESLTGPSKDEFAEAKPGIQSLVALNAPQNHFIRLNASGYSTFETVQVEGEEPKSVLTYRACQVSIEQNHTQIAI